MRSFLEAFTFVKGQICEFPVRYRPELRHLVLVIQCFVRSDGSIVTRVQDFSSTCRCTSVFRAQKAFGKLAPCANNNPSDDHHLPSCNDLQVATSSHPPQVRSKDCECRDLDSSLRG